MYRGFKGDRRFITGERFTLTYPDPGWIMLSLTAAPADFVQPLTPKFRTAKD